MAKGKAGAASRSEPARKGRTLAAMSATFAATFAKWVAVAICVAGPLYPAISTNIEAASDRGITGAVTGVVFVVLGAGAFHRMRTATGVANKSLFFALFLIFGSISGLNAIHNLSSRGEDARDLRSGQIEEHRRTSQQRSQWSQVRDDMVAKVANAAPESFDAEARALISRESSKWQATQECNPQFITAGASRKFCSEVEEIRGKAVSARKRDEAVAKVSELDTKLGSQRSPETADPLADWIAGVLRGLGHKIDDDGLKSIAKLVVAAQAAGIELAGEVGPDILLAILFGLLARTSKEAPERVGKPAREKPDVCSDSEDQAMAAFSADCLEFEADQSIPATPLYRAWCIWCSAHSVEAGSQRAFSTRVQKLVRRDEHGGRPRYIGIRLRETGKPSLKIVSQ